MRDVSRYFFIGFWRNDFEVKDFLIKIVFNNFLRNPQFSIKRFSL